MTAQSTWPGPTCSGCGGDLEACDGLESDWMHDDRREACPAGGWARLAGYPEWDEHRRRRIAASRRVA